MGNYISLKKNERNKPWWPAQCRLHLMVRNSLKFDYFLRFFLLKSPSNCHLRPGNTVWHTNDRPSDEFTTWPQGHVLQQRFWREWPRTPLHALHARLLHHAAWPSGTRRPQTDLEANRVYFRIQNFHLWDCTVWVTHTGSLTKATDRIVKIISHYRNNKGGGIEMKSNGGDECIMKIWAYGHHLKFIRATDRLTSLVSFYFWSVIRQTEGKI